MIGSRVRDYSGDEEFDDDKEKNSRDEESDEHNDSENEYDDENSDSEDNESEDEKHDSWGDMNPSDIFIVDDNYICLLYTSPSPRDMRRSRMPSSA